ncbi:hypothetical protein KJZ71_01470 [Patescibacteria group bacterium]|nr:hypothetical protein [Patescibacteria group bacterium]MDL1952638.1 hypothetical protein [Candidatus Uhrbacteria bacterium UHB]
MPDTVEHKRPLKGGVMLNIPFIEPDLHKRLGDELQKLATIHLPAIEIRVLSEDEWVFAGAVEVEIRERQHDRPDGPILFYYVFDWSGVGYLHLPNPEGSEMIDAFKLPDDPSESFPDWRAAAADLIRRTADEAEKRMLPFQQAILDFRSLDPSDAGSPKCGALP